LRQLTSLELNKNQLTALPVGFGKLTQLRTLELGGNQLTGLTRDYTEHDTLKESLHLTFFSPASQSSKTSTSAQEQFTSLHP